MVKGHGVIRGVNGESVRLNGILEKVAESAREPVLPV